MKRLILICIAISWRCAVFAQSSTAATVSYVLGMGANMTGCITSHGHTTSTEKDGFMMLKDYYNSDSLTNFPTNTPCSPTFASWANMGNTSPTSTQIYNSSIAYNPADQYEYFYTVVDTTVAGAHIYNTDVFRWPVGTCPTGTQEPIQEFKETDLLSTFDNSGNSWAIDIIPSGDSNLLALQKITFSGSTATLGPLDTISLPPGTPPITNGDGDFIFTPSGDMFLVINNEEIAIGYQAYTATQKTIVGTYIGQIALPTGSYVVGLAFAGGSMIGAVATAAGLTCSPPYVQINMITGATTAEKYPGGFNANDEATLVSGVGSAKSLVSVTATGNPNEYVAVYDVFVENFGNYPVSNIQATDVLGNINGSANVKSVTTAFVGTPPPASYNINLNTSFNGTTNDSLLQTGGTLYYYPVPNDDFTIQVTVVLEGIQKEVVYNNTAVAYGNGYNMDNLVDTSTNGTNPDLNDNDRPDDPGEDIPTPFVILLAAQSAPCVTLPTVLFQETFGTSGTATSLQTPAMPAGGTTQYTPTTTQPVGTNDYTLSKNANNGNTANWISLTDHTAGSGDMMLVNADVPQDIVYQTEVTGLCTNLKYSFNAYVANISDTAAITFCNAVGGYQPPNLEFQMIDATSGLTLANLSTGPILTHSWTSYGMRIPLPLGASGNVYLNIINVGGGGCGNDFALDDISFGLCDPQPSVVVDGLHAGCLDSATILQAKLSDSTVFNGPVTYQWEDSTAGGNWTTTMPPGIVGGSNNDSLEIYPVTPANAIYYRVNVATPGNQLSGCSYFSPAFLLILKSGLSTPPVTATKSGDEGCTLAPVTLSEVGGSLATGAQWTWYTGTCGGTAIGTGSSIVVEPSITTAYFVQAVGACNTTTCASVAVNVVCALPTDLLYFNGSIASDIVTLSWEVTDNQNLKGFYVERSLDGITFTQVDSVGAVPDDGEATYSWQDNVASLHTQNINYRIVLIFKTGDTLQSSVVAISKPLNLSEGIVVYPNPASTQLTIAVNSDKQQSLSYTLISMQGQVLLVGSQSLSKGANSVNVNGLQILTSGAYIIRIQLQDALVEKKVIIQK